MSKKITGLLPAPLKISAKFYDNTAILIYVKAYSQFDRMHKNPTL